MAIQGSLGRLDYGVQSARGTAQTSLQTLAFVTGQFARTQTKIESATIDGSGQNQGKKTVSVSGTVNFTRELKPAVGLELYENMLGSSFDGQVFTDTELGGVTATGSIFATSDTTGIAVGTMLYHEGFDNTENNGVHIVTTVNSDTDYRCSGSTLADELDGDSTAKKAHIIGVYSQADDDIDAVSDGLVSTTTDFTDYTFKVGDWIKIGGAATANKFTTAANNGYARISAVAANKLTLDRLPSGWTAETSSGSKRLHIKTMRRCVLGTTDKYLTLQSLLKGSSDTYDTAQDVVLTSMVVSITEGANVTEAFTGFAGIDEVSSPFDASPDTQVVQDVCGPINEVKHIFLDGTDTTDSSIPKTITLNVTLPGAVERTTLRQSSNIGVARNSNLTTVEIAREKDGKAVFDAYKADSSFDFQVALQSGNRAVIFDLADGVLDAYTKDAIAKDVLVQEQFTISGKQKATGINTTFAVFTSEYVET